MQKKIDAAQLKQLNNLALKQFDEFWEMECPHCKKKIDLEVILNSFKK